MNDHLSEKELFIRLTASAFRKLLSMYAFSCFPFSFEGRMWDLIVSVPDSLLICVLYTIVYGAIPLLRMIKINISYATMPDRRRVCHIGFGPLTCPASLKSRCCLTTCTFSFKLIYSSKRCHNKPTVDPGFTWTSFFYHFILKINIQIKF